jgi:integrase
MFVPDKKLPGLYRRERTTGDKWVVKAKQRGRNVPVTVTLGRVDVIKLQDARRLAIDVLAQLAAGRNPNQEAKQKLDVEKAISITLQQALDEYLELRDLKPSTLKSYRQVFARCFGVWLSRPIREIGRNDVVKRYKSIQEGIAKRKKQPVKANPRGLADAQKAMRYLSAVMESFANDTYQGQPVLPDGNPVLVLKDKKARKHLKARTRFLSRRERRDIFDELSHVDHPEYAGSLKDDQADFVLLLMITGLRLDEARSLRWENITEHTYTVTDTKNGEEHTLPITSVVKGILERNSNESPWLFQGRDGAAASMSSAIKSVAGPTGVSFTAHDLRRTAATIAAEHGFSRDQIGRLLNHKSSNVTEGYIQRTADALKPILETIEDEILARYEDLPEQSELSNSDAEDISFDNPL